MKNKNGFTLTELLVVIAIIAVIAVIAVPSIVIVNNNINKRLYNSKIEHIETAAKLYGSDNPEIFNGRNEVKVYVSELIDSNYLEKEVDKDSADNCKGDALGTEYPSTKGCVIDPVEKTSMNNEFIILKKESVGVVAEYNGTLTPQAQKDSLVATVCAKLENGEFLGKDANGTPCNCDNISNTNTACLITGGSDVNNYLKYDGIMWRVMGVYNIQGNTSKLSAKIINDDNVEIVVN